MFGLRKPKKAVSIFDRVISNQIENELYDDKPIPRQSYHEAQEYFLENGQMNYAIPNDLIALLPQTWRRYAYRLDFQKLFEEEENKSITDEILNSMSHELRTPIVAIKAYTDMLLENKFGELTPEQKQRIELIKKNTNFLTKTIFEMLEKKP